MAEDLNDLRLERQLGAWAAPQQRISLDLQNRIAQELSASLTAVNVLPSKRVLVMRFLLVFITCGAGLMAMLDKSGFRLMTAGQMAAMAAILAGGELLFSFTLARLMVPGSRQPLSILVVLALPLLAVIAGMALFFPWRIPQAFVAEGWPCAALEVAIAIPATVVFWVLARRGALCASPALGAVLAGVAIFTALLPLQFQCMFPQSFHLLVWHGGPAVILMVAGAVAGGLRANRR